MPCHSGLNHCPPALSASYESPVWNPAVQLPVQFPANTSRKAMEDVPSAWVPPPLRKTWKTQP